MRTSKLAAFLALNLTAIAARSSSTPIMPSFFARHDYVQHLTGYVLVGDTNGDGIPDLIVIGTFGGINVWFGNGDGTFRPGPTSSTAPAVTPYTSIAADLNGDGKIDVIMAVTYGRWHSSVPVCLGNGDGTFQPVVEYPLNDNPYHLVAGDFSGDGVMDIAATVASSGVWLFTGKGDGTFNPAALAISLQNASNIGAADFNGDGKLDLVVTFPSAGGGFDVFLGNGDGTFQNPQTFNVPQNPAALAVGSLTKGGPPSIVVSKPSSNDVYLYFGNGAGAFTGPKVVNLPVGSPNGLAIGDLNGDGWPDLVSLGPTENSAYIAYGKGAGRFSAPVEYAIEGWDGSFNLALSDLKNNGQLDILTSGNQAVSVLLNIGRGAFEDGIWTTLAGGANCGVGADFNRDGKPDLAVNNAQGISILLGTGVGTTPFTAGTNIALAGAGCLVTGDLNRDGIPDLLVPANGTVVAYLGNGDGTFTLKSTTATPSGGYLVLANFNHDGKLDFATSGNLLAYGNGDGTFQAPINIVNPPSSVFAGIAAGDINNDGWPDLVFTYGNAPTNVLVLLNNHSGGFTQVPTNFGMDTVQPTLMDLNGDGYLDLILTAWGTVNLYLGDGQGNFTSLTSLVLCN